MILTMLLHTRVLKLHDKEKDPMIMILTMLLQTRVQRNMIKMITLKTKLLQTDKGSKEPEDHQLPSRATPPFFPEPFVLPGIQRLRTQSFLRFKWISIQASITWRMIIMIKFVGTNFLKLPQIPPTPFPRNPYSLETFER